MGPHNISDQESTMYNLIVLLLVGLSYAAAECPRRGSSNVEWVERGDSCYYFVATPTSWIEADQYCTYLNPGFANTHLLSIDDSEEQQWIQNYLSTRPEFRQRNFWTSGNIIDRRRGWAWAGNGQQFSYTNWAPGEPNNSGACAQIWGEFNYQWDDADCYGYINFICEYDRSREPGRSTNAPGTTLVVPGTT